MAGIRTLLQFDKKIKNEDKKNTWFPQCPIKATFCVAYTILLLLLKSVHGLLSPSACVYMIRHELGLVDLFRSRLIVTSKVLPSSVWSVILVLIISVFYISQFLRLCCVIIYDNGTHNLAYCAVTNTTYVHLGLKPGHFQCFV